MMSGQGDSELDAWREQWHAQNALTDDLRRRVEREIRVLRRGLFAAIGVTIVFGLGIPLWALVSRRLDVVVLAAGVWVFIAITWIVSVRLNRDLSRPATATTAAYLEFCIANCRSRRSAIAAAGVLYAVIFTFDLAWIFQTRARPAELSEFLTSPFMLFAFAVTVVLGVVALRARRRLGRELDTLLKLRKEL
jgi:hypothetical protein